MGKSEYSCLYLRLVVVSSKLHLGTFHRMCARDRVFMRWHLRLIEWNLVVLVLVERVT